MTNPSHGPSLAQARDLHSRTHSFHRLGHVQHQHQHRHQHRHPHDLAPNPHDDHREPATDSDPDDKLLHHRDAVPAVDAVVDIPPPNPTTLVTHVVQSISLVHIVDTSGDPVETQTRHATPNTVVVDSTSGETVAVSLPDTATTLPAPGSSSGPSTIALPSLSPSSSDTALTQAPTNLASSSLASVAPSTPLTTSLPTLGDVPHNATDINPSRNGTASQFFAASKNATFSLTLSLSSSTTLSLTSSTTTESGSTTRPASLSENLIATFSSDDPIATGGVTNGGAGAGDTAGDDTQPTPAASPVSDDSDLTPQQKQVIVGGVVGSIAGVAFLGLLVMLVLRYKRRRSNGAFLGAIQPGAASRGLPPSGALDGGDGSGSGSGSGGVMAERYGPAAITAALAGLAGKGSSTAPNSADSGERGFYRVSGRKLPSVLQVGGDGYSDPRESVMSGVSDYYRGSQAFEPLEGGGSLLALGTPMRPVSGVPIMRSGPARVAVTEQNPFADPPSTPPGDDPVPSLASRDSPRGPGSKFQESI